MDQANSESGLGRVYQVEVGDGLSLQFQDQFGIPRPRWSTFREHAVMRPDANGLMRDALNVWVGELARAMGQPYRPVAGENVLLLSGRDDQTSDLILRQCEFFRQEIARILAGIVDFSLEETDVVLVFNRGEQYASYVAPHYPDGDSAGSGGMCITSEADIHIAILWDRWGWHRTLAHELTHVALASLGLPLWLEEGLVAVTEQELAPQELAYHKLAAKELLETRRYWLKHDLLEFWSGSSFIHVEGQEHAYRLAEVMVRNLADHYGKRFAGFVRAAKAEDHGAGAAQLVLGTSLQKCASLFLGAGD